MHTARLPFLLLESLYTMDIDDMHGYALGSGQQAQRISEYVIRGFWHPPHTVQKEVVGHALHLLPAKKLSLSAASMTYLWCVWYFTELFLSAQKRDRVSFVCKLQ